MKNRPVFLNLFRMTLPIPAVMSITHRLTGVAMSLSLIWLLYMLYFIKVCNEYSWRWLTSLIVWKITALIVVAVFLWHLLAGLRHIWDDYFGDHTLQSAHSTAILMLIIWLVLCASYFLIMV